MARKKDPKTGLFVATSDRPKVQKSFWLRKELIDGLQALKRENETVADLVNDAIAYYLANHQRQNQHLNPASVHRGQMDTSNPDSVVEFCS